MRVERVNWYIKSLATCARNVITASPGMECVPRGFSDVAGSQLVKLIYLIANNLIYV